MVQLFSPLQIRSLQFKNRIFVSPMCQYSSLDGVANAWHLVHLGGRAVGGAALVICESTAVSSEARISYGDAGLWNVQQVEALKPVTSFIHSQNAFCGVQLGHAGRKASTNLPWVNRGGPIEKTQPNGWQSLAPSAIAFDAEFDVPLEMSRTDLEKVVHDFENATKLSIEAGFDVVELHMAHGYLLHEFLSPLSNFRRDEYGGILENRMRLPLLIAEKVRKIWPKELPLFVRISASDWTDNGWDIEQSIRFCKELEKIGVDFIDCSSGGNIAQAKIKTAPGYQVPFAKELKANLKIPVGAVGLITDPEQAEAILSRGDADVVLLARELLRDPYWPLHAAKVLGHPVSWPKQYERAK